MDTPPFLPKRFAVIGAGPVGCIVAAFLSKGGHHVTLCDVNRALLEPALEPGILIEGTDSLQARVAKVTTRVEDLQDDRPDVIVVAVKATALPAVASSLRGLYDEEGRGPYAISWQNGIDTENVLAQQLGAQHVLRGVINFGCVFVEPGHVRIAFHHRPHHIQEMDPRTREAAIAICRAFTECGLATAHTEHIHDLVWRKAILNACMNPICAVTGKTMAEIIQDPILFHLVGALIKEGVSVARANEFALGSGFYAYCINYIKTAGNHKPSMLQDIEAGRRTEVDFINGKIAEYGAQAEVPTPYNTMIRGLVKALESKDVGKGLDKVGMDIRTRVDRLAARMHEEPQYPGQGAVLFVDLELRKSIARYLPLEVLQTFLTNRGSNLHLLYNLLLEGREALDPQVPLIFGSGAFPGTAPAAGGRGAMASIAPDGRAVLDSSCGDAFPAFLHHQGYDHLVLYGQAAAWTLLELSEGGVRFHDAVPYLGTDNAAFTRAIEKDFACLERRDMALARITRAGENQVLCAAVMGGPTAAWTGGGTGAKMGALKLKGVLILGRGPRQTCGLPPEARYPSLQRRMLVRARRPRSKAPARPMVRRTGSVAGGSPWGAGWLDALDAERAAGFRAGLEGCPSCPIRCHDNAGADPEPPSCTLVAGSLPASSPSLASLLGVRDPAPARHLDALTHELGLDPRAAGAAILWARDLCRHGLLGPEDAGGLDLAAQDAAAVEGLLTLTARREGFGDVIADSTLAVERGKYRPEAAEFLPDALALCRPDDAMDRLLEGFAAGFAEAAHESVRPGTVPDPARAALYDGFRPPSPEAAGLPSTPPGGAPFACGFAQRLREGPPAASFLELARGFEAISGEPLTLEHLEVAARNVSGLERLLRVRLGLAPAPSTPADRWFDEPASAGPYTGEVLDHAKLEALRGRAAGLLGLEPSGLLSLGLQQKLAAVTTGFALKVVFPEGFPGVPGGVLVLDQPVASVAELRLALVRRLGPAAKALEDPALLFAVGGTVILGNEKGYLLKSGDEATLLRSAGA